MITVVALGKSKFGSIWGYINPFWASFFYFLRFFLSFLQFFILESCYIWFKLSLQYPIEYVYSFALVKFKIWVYLVVCKPCFEPYCPFSEIFFYFFNFSLESFWVRNAVCFRISTHAVGSFSLRLVSTNFFQKKWPKFENLFRTSCKLKGPTARVLITNRQNYVPNWAYIALSDPNT